MRSKGVAEAARALLLREGYTIVEVQRVVGSAVDRGILKWSVDSAQLLIDSALNGGPTSVMHSRVCCAALTG